MACSACAAQRPMIFAVIALVLIICLSLWLYDSQEFKDPWKPRKTLTEITDSKMLAPGDALEGDGARLDNRSGQGMFIGTWALKRTTENLSLGIQNGKLRLFKQGSVTGDWSRGTDVKSAVMRAGKLTLLKADGSVIATYGPSREVQV